MATSEGVEACPGSQVPRAVTVQDFTQSAVNVVASSSATKVCTDKSSKGKTAAPLRVLDAISLYDSADADGKVLVQFKCCCPSCQKKDAESDSAALGRTPCA